MQDTLKDNSNRIENKLISAAKKYAGFLEAKTNHSAYENIYDLPLKELKKSLKEQKETLKSLDILLSHKGYKKYLTQIRRLSHSMRWSGESKLLPISVMAHLVEVTFISYIIASIENHDKKDSIDTLEMLLRSIYHDIPEAITGDIINPTKKSVPGFAEVLEKVEKAMLDDYLFCHAPKNFKTEIERYIFQPFDEKEGKLVKYSDIFAALFEAKIEGLYGNTREFEDICKNLEKILSPLPLKSVQYLLHQGISSFVEKNGIN